MEREFVRIKNLCLACGLIVLLSACGQQHTRNSENNHTIMKQAQLPATELQQIDERIEAYKARDKFAGNDNYPGIGYEEMREPLNNLLNLLADSFQNVAHENPDDKLYQLAIRQLLVAMKDIYLDSEDQDQFCISIEELMDIVGLESSGGLLNKWRYGF